MSTEVRLRQDTAANVGVYTLASGELGYKTDTKEVVVGDGSTVGGNAIAKKSQVDSLSTTVSTHTTQIATANTNISNNSGIISSHTSELSVTTPNANYAAALAAQQDRELAAFIQNYKQQKSFVNLIPSDPTSFTRASSATYFDANGVMQTAASGVKRYTHDPLTLQPLGLLIEESRTNSFLQSDSITNAAWSKASSTVTAVNDYFKLDDNSTNAWHAVTQTLTLTSGTTYTMSVYLKAAELIYAKLLLPPSIFGERVLAAFDLQAGTVLVPSAGTSSTAAITHVGAGWYRCSITAQATATASGILWIRTAVAYDLDASGYVGNGSGIYIRRPQIEAGSFPSSYIPTTNAAVTRVADTLSDTVNTATYLNGSRGTVFADFYVPYLNSSGSGANGRQVVWRIRHSATNNLLALMYEGANLRLLAYNGSTRSYTNLTGVISTTQRNKVAIAYNVVGGAFTPIVSINGTTVAGVAASGFDMPSPALYVGTESSSRYLNGTISRLTYYKRALSQTELNGLTA